MSIANDTYSETQYYTFAEYRTLHSLPKGTHTFDVVVYTTFCLRYKQYNLWDGKGKHLQNSFFVSILILMHVVCLCTRDSSDCFPFVYILHSFFLLLSCLYLFYTSYAWDLGHNVQKCVSISSDKYVSEQEESWNGFIKEQILIWVCVCMQTNLRTEKKRKVILFFSFWHHMCLRCCVIFIYGEHTRVKRS